MAAAQAGEDAERLIRAVMAENLPLAGRCLAEYGAEALPDLKRALQDALLERQRSRKANLPARIEAGLALGELGHPHLQPQPFAFEGKTVWAVLPAMQPIAAGEFWFGSSSKDAGSYDDEYTSRRKRQLSAFSIGRYPVTNAEFACFVRADGYQQPRWWSTEGWAWRQGGLQAHAAALERWLDFWRWVRRQDLQQRAREWGWMPRTLNFWRELQPLTEEAARQRAQQLFSRPFDRPAFWEDPALSSPSRPVVGVNAHEAEAYCCWLSAVTGHTFCLPDEEHWERAARGQDGRAYPWGPKFDSGCCNSSESQIWVTTPVGMFDEGRSPDGGYDFAGNVWEWTSSCYGPYEGGAADASSDYGCGYRVLRGGSWDNSERNVRCAIRYRFASVSFSDSDGFRLFSPDIFLKTED